MGVEMLKLKLMPSSFRRRVIVLAFAYAICKFFLMLIPPNVPSIDLDASDGIFFSLFVSAPRFVMYLSRRTSLSRGNIHDIER
ncbi:hypothetical protein ARALYDRAFT_892222 [Arabidopsis lyrata subsp. lyrata]|uniref:Uncharacterized protein n=1 Tax=Arabidopsis lyrata subsp. lyrata TaxID=81972 RepID=D7KIQ2_ARALL|nr:hypothetical protein ARALYDRAFT_892222 [Arabidopsis lyrata subsp. lyrata]